MTTPNPFLTHRSNQQGNNGDPSPFVAPQRPTNGVEVSQAPASPAPHGRHSANSSQQSGAPFQEAPQQSFDPMEPAGGRFSKPTGPAAAPYGMTAEPTQVQEEAVAASIDGDHPLGLPYYNCPMGDAVIRFFKNYVKFSGRASRSEFWWSVLAITISDMILSMLGAGMPSIVGNIFTIVLVVFQLSIIVPSISILTRRAHDSNLSGWWVFGYYALYVIAGGLTVTGLLRMFTPSKMIVLSNSQSLATLSEMTLDPTGLNMMAFGGLISLAAVVLFLVITLRGPKPEGVRFDKQYIQSDSQFKAVGQSSNGDDDADSDAVSNILD